MRYVVLCILLICSLHTYASDNLVEFRYLSADKIKVTLSDFTVGGVALKGALQCAIEEREEHLHKK